MTATYSLCELRKSPHGVGVFAEFPIKRHQNLKLWRPGDWRVWNPRTFEELRWCDKWCIYAWDKFYGPRDPYRMSLAWYVNHSSKPNMKSTYAKNGRWQFVSLRIVKAGEELTVNYSTLDYYGK
jgi:SET domain